MRRCCLSQVAGTATWRICTYCPGQEPSNTCGVTWPFKRAIVACAWPVAGQAGSPPAFMLPDGAAWTKAVYTMEILALLQAAKSDVSPHISLPTYLIGLGSGGTIAYQIAVSETPASFRACVCGLPSGCLMRLCLCADIYLGGRSCKPG